MIPARTIQSGASAAMRAYAEAQTISFVGAQPWKHPWQTTPRWSARSQRWLASVRPGFVNARTPMVRTTIAEQGKADLDFGINPLTGKPFFSDPIFDHGSTGPTSSTFDIPLYLDPAIALDFYNVGFDGAADIVVPPFFRARGVEPAPSTSLLDDGPLEFASVTPPQPPRGLRLLRASDVILHQPRSRLTSQISIEPGLVTGQTHVQQTLGVGPQIPGDVLRVLSGLYRSPEAAGIDPLKRDYEEPPWDELVIATVFLLSPPNTEPGSEPDVTWTPYVRHGLFWNLNYATPPLRLPVIDPTIGFIPPLGAGAAQIVINYLTSAINDILQDALNLVTGHSLAGTFWTPTGGGHDAVFPEESAIAGLGAGLDKRAALDAAARQARAAIRGEKLDPDFPYRALPFNPELLAA